MTGPVMRRTLRLLAAALAMLLGVAAAGAETTGALGGASRGGVATARGPGVAAIAARAVIASAPQFSGETGRSRFSLHLDRVVPASAFTLADPYRVVVDLPEVVFPAGSNGRAAIGVVTGWRAGLFMSGRSRIVFDTAGPTRVAELSVTPLDDGSARLDLRLETVGRDAFRSGATVTAAAAPAEAVPADIGAATTAGMSASGAALVAAKGDREPVRPPPKAAAAPERRVVVLDPGHGGIDPGTRSPATGLVEKTVVLAFAQLLKQKLDATGRYTVYMTRDDDTFVPLAERVRFARKHHADIFVSIHVDAEFDHQVRGATVYTVADQGSDDKSEALAAKENASDAVAGVVPEDSVDEVTDILLDLTRRETRLLNQSLAGVIAHGLGDVGRLVGGTGHRSANFRVLKAYDVPSVLVELGFITNKDDEAQLTATPWRERAAKAMVAAIESYFAGHVAGSR
jgi:N-acetylmuramoyl-L-alanine amidase